jgi:hypothetical protein
VAGPVFGNADISIGDLVDDRIRVRIRLMVRIGVSFIV